ncbi:MAG: glycosyltransferase [Coleofasciculus sp. A1-SPW-01]|uniref:glycosyltransferase n=1 Tax=Coleofasciculus sp. A1-SPW-01 TaxID=3070819 RepID=UPI003300F4E3
MSQVKLNISLVTTVLNDQSGCADFLKSMAAQTYLPDEIVIVDGGSTDGTWQFLQNYSHNQFCSLQVIQEIGCNIARGRNLAIAQAQHDIIVSTDIGCTWDSLWLEELVQPLLKDNQLEAVMGSWQVRWQDLKTDWAKVEYALHDGLKLIATPKSHASSRSIAYRKSLWEKIGGYPEDLTLAGDDMVFALLLQQTTTQVTCAPIPRCYWQRPVTLTSFCQEAFRNFRGGGEAGIWLDYGVLVSGRLCFEAFCLMFSLVFLFWASPTWLGIVFLSSFLISAGARVRRLVPAIQRLNSCSYIKNWYQLLVFEYIIRVWGVIGYWQGFVWGFKRCKQCRERLRNLKLRTV